jgi:PilZ domain
MRGIPNPELGQLDEVAPEHQSVAERRTAPRYMMSASAAVSDATSGARLAARVGDLSITGCYLDSINSFPEGTRLRLHICRDDKEFHGEGTVRYAKSGMGMGLAFLHLDHEQEGVLQGWIERLAPSGRVGFSDTGVPGPHLPRIPFIRTWLAGSPGERLERIRPSVVSKEVKGSPDSC